MSPGVAAALYALSAAAPVVVDTLAVPFLSQGILLCGGASAAMVERYHGERGVYSSDYRHLVRPEEGGIRTTDLADELGRRGFRVEVRRNQAEAVLADLAAGNPPIVLLGSGEAGFHYVVLVDWAEGVVRVHDPLFGPARPMAEDELLRRWSESGYWTLVATPDADAVRLPDPEAAAPGSEIAPGVPRAPSLESPPPDPALLEALRRVREGDFAGAADYLGPRLSALPTARDRATAWRLIATARLRSDDPSGALDAWNRLGEPVVDLVRIDGVRNHRWPLLERAIPARPGTPLTARDLALSRRRLRALPGIEAARVDYRPLENGTVELEAVVQERARLPGGVDLAGAIVTGLVDSRVSLGAGPFLAGAERIAVGGRWLPGAAHAQLSLSTPLPPLPGVATVGFRWDRQLFQSENPTAAPLPEEVLDASLGGSHWVAPNTRIELGGGLQRWTPRGAADSAPSQGGVSPVAGRYLYLRGGVEQILAGLPGGIDLLPAVEAAAWGGGGPGFRRFRGSLRGQRVDAAGAFRLTAGVSHASGRAPKLLWDGAGTGAVRDPLLRGERLIQSGVIGGRAFGRTLAHLSLERTHELERFGPLAVSGLAFTDVARAWHGISGQGDTLASAGVGLELALGPRRWQVSLATGSGDWVLSARAAIVPDFG